MRWGILSVLVAMLLALPASAVAAPANDDFVDREVLSGDLPIEATGSNVGATKEEGEYIPGLAPAGHSVWFEWEAEADGWVTIGACDNEFPSILAVFTGTAVNALTPAAEGNGSEGPDCPSSGRQFSLKAVAGTKYVIAVDGNIFHLPESPVPVTEGPIELKVEATPVPANDDFEDASVLDGSIYQEPGGNRFFFANARGYNWTATAESGEPEVPATGASVWYSFTAPEEAEYWFDRPCCQTAFALRRDLYIGESIDQLTPFAAGVEVPKVHLAAGTTLMIRVSGPVDDESEEPATANFAFNVSAELAHAPVAERSDSLHTVLNPLPLSTPPRPVTRLARRIVNQRARLARFRFSSPVTASFQCKLDRRPFRRCRSPKTYRHLKPGRHRFKVRAVSADGLVDPTPAVSRFRIAVPRHRR